MNTAVEVKTPQALALQVLVDLGNGKIVEAVNVFAERFMYEDRGIGFDCTERDRLIAFFEKARELYPDFVMEPGPSVASGNDVAVEWTVRTSVAEAFFGHLTRRTPVVISGVSVVRTENGRVTRWLDYYDGLRARRTALTSYFTEWVEV